MNPSCQEKSLKYEKLSFDKYTRKFCKRKPPTELQWGEERIQRIQETEAELVISPTVLKSSEEKIPQELGCLATKDSKNPNKSKSSGISISSVISLTFNPRCWARAFFNSCLQTSIPIIIFSFSP